MSEEVQTLDQRRAKHAWKKVESIQKKIDEAQGEKQEEIRQKGDDYSSYVVELVGSVRINGLGQALAQLCAAAKGETREEKEEDPHMWLYRNVEDWLCGENTLFSRKSDLLEQLIHSRSDQYFQAQGEALAWLEWHKKLAVAFLKQNQVESNKV